MSDRPDPDWLGAALATLGLGALTWGLTAWSATHRLGDNAGVAARRRRRCCSAPSFWVEHAAQSQAMVPLAMFGSRAFVGLTLFTFLLYGALGGLMLLLPYVLIEARALSGGDRRRGPAALPDHHRPGLAAHGQARRPDRPALAAHASARCSSPAGFALALRIGAEGSYWTTVLPAILADLGRHGDRGRAAHHRRALLGRGAAMSAPPPASTAPSRAPAA